MEVERKRGAKRKREGPGSLSDTLQKWREITEELEGEHQARKVPAKGSRKGCMKGKGGPENPACKFRGVRQRVCGKWVAEIREPNGGKRMWLGTFRTDLEAAYAYDEAARSMYGHSARLNFPYGDGSTSSVVLKESGSTESGVLVHGGGAATEERPLVEPNEGMIQIFIDFTDVDEILRMLDAEPLNTEKAGGFGADYVDQQPCSSPLLFQLQNPSDAEMLGTFNESGRTERKVLVDGGAAATEPNEGMIGMVDADPWNIDKAAGFGAAFTEERTSEPNERMIQPAEDFTDADVDEIMRMLDADP